MTENKQNKTKNSLTVKPLNRKIESAINRSKCYFPIEGLLVPIFSTLNKGAIEKNRTLDQATSWLTQQKLSRQPPCSQPSHIR